MTYPGWLILAAQIVTWLAAILATLFCGLYGYLAPWRRSAGGRTTMELPASLALVLDLNVAASAYRYPPLWYVIVYVLAFCLVPLALVRRTVLLIRLQITARRQLQMEKESPHEDPRVPA